MHCFHFGFVKISILWASFQKHECFDNISFLKHHSKKPSFGAGIKIAFGLFQNSNFLTFFGRHVPKNVVLKSACGRNSALEKYSFSAKTFS